MSSVHRLSMMLLLTAALISTTASVSRAFPSGKKSPEEEAEKRSQKAVASYNQGVERQHVAGSLWNKGDTAKARGEFKRAAAAYEKAVKLKEAFPEALSNLGYCRRHLGDYTGALDAYGQALKLKPDFAEALEYRGVAYLKLGRMTDAMADYDRLKVIDSTEAAELWQEIEKAQKGQGEPPQEK